MGLTITAIVCAYNESRLLPGCLYSLRSQTRPPDDILVINNASTDETGDVARAVPGVRVIDEPSKGLVVARETARRAAQTDIVAYIDADCRVPIDWLRRIEARFERLHSPIAVTGPYRFYDWDWSGRALLRTYDFLSRRRRTSPCITSLAPARSCTVGTSPSAATRSRLSAASTAGSSFTGRTRISDAA
jgi:Glycosyltransferases involved in cell wall biogenesis